jgi:amidase
MHVITSEKHAFAFCPDTPPVLRVKPGDIVRFETSPEPPEKLFAAGDDWVTQLDTQRLNAVTGPVFIEGVQPGDTVSVEILEIETADWGWCMFTPRGGLLGYSMVEPLLRRMPVKDGLVWISEALTVPVRPMVGCLGVAPESGESSSLAPIFPWGGNLDLLQMTVGSTALFPAQVAGGLFSLGDLHAAMGDAEGTSVSIECAGAATVRLGVRQGLRLQTPRIETADRLYTIGIGERGDYGSAKRHAANLMFDYLTEERLLTPEDAYILFSACVDITFGGPAGTVAVASVPLSVLAERESRMRGGR